ncbi:MAG: CdaR family transcriptional regulator, partial [Lachnospiraceae bacterium]|nr:CdaR family transcriptional regulator [Lachnospiraceae bacterium]
MDISRSAAQSIVTEIGGILHENINLMDDRGYIIASVDQSRIGDLHEGAKKIIEEGLSELYITKKMESPTVKQGINLPIVVDNKIVGVVGITGSRKTVMPYGTIVKRMAEIMIQDAINKEQNRFEDRIMFRFIGEWLNKDSIVYDKSFSDRGTELGIDVSGYYRIMVIHVDQFQRLAYTKDGQQLLSDLEHRTRFLAETRNFIYMRQPPRQMLLIP